MIAAELYALRQKYPTWVALAYALNCDVRGLNDHKGEADLRRKASPALVTSVTRLLEKHYPFPLPGYQNSIRTRLGLTKKLSGTPELLEVISEIEGIVADCKPTDAWHAAGLLYLEMLACHARAMCNGGQSFFGDRTALRASLARAQSAAGEARAIVAQALVEARDEEYRRRLEQLDVWLFLNWCVIIGDTVAGDVPVEKNSLKDVLIRHQALESFKTALSTLPHEWRVPYNGLDGCAKIEAENNDMDLFYARLLTFDIGFASFRYTPGEVYSIESNPDWGHFRSRFESQREEFPLSNTILERRGS